MARDLAGGEPVGQLGCGLRAVDHRPRHDEELDVGAGPFEIGDGDAASRSGCDRLGELRIAEGVDIAVALQTLLVRVHRP